LQSLHLSSHADESQDEQAASLQDDFLTSGRLQFATKLQNLYANTDIAELCEEVAEGAVAGKTHMQSETDIAGSSAGTYSGRDHSESSFKQKRREDDNFGFNRNVAVVLDFDYQKDWTYITQPGALRRILMNILGNSLKYTASGCIRVRLGIQPFEDPISMFLCVSDTGRGISQEFLRNKLFSPFSQEDYLSAGCGLGLSIVKSLVKTLKGSIEIQSEQRVSDGPARRPGCC
jgi:signal transduction histidine kinase